MSALRRFTLIPTAAAAAGEPPEGGGPPSQPPSPTVTHYQKVAADFMVALDELLKIIPKFEADHITTAEFVRTRQSVPMPFIATTVTAIEQTPELQAVRKFDTVAARDKMQYLEAFRPVYDKMSAARRTLKYSMFAEKATLGIACLHAYAIAQALVREPGSENLEPLVENMRRDLGKRFVRSSPPDSPTPATPAPAAPAPAAPTPDAPAKKAA